jgi:hypothetical protein
MVEIKSIKYEEKIRVSDESSINISIAADITESDFESAYKLIKETVQAKLMERLKEKQSEELKQPPTPKQINYIKQLTRSKNIEVDYSKIKTINEASMIIDDLKNNRDISYLEGFDYNNPEDPVA